MRQQQQQQPAHAGAGQQRDHGGWRRSDRGRPAGGRPRHDHRGPVRCLPRTVRSCLHCHCVLASCCRVPAGRMQLLAPGTSRPLPGTDPGSTAAGNPCVEAAPNTVQAIQALLARNRTLQRSARRASTPSSISLPPIAGAARPASAGEEGVDLDTEHRLQSLEDACSHLQSELGHANRWAGGGGCPMMHGMLQRAQLSTSTWMKWSHQAMTRSARPAPCSPNQPEWIHQTMTWSARPAPCSPNQPEARHASWQQHPTSPAPGPRRLGSRLDTWSKQIDAARDQASTALHAMDANTQALEQRMHGLEEWKGAAAAAPPAEQCRLLLHVVAARLLTAHTPPPLMPGWHVLRAQVLRLGWRRRSAQHTTGRPWS